MGIRWPMARGRRDYLQMRQDHFGEDVAAAYDESCRGMFAPERLGPTVDVLAELAGDEATLEFAIGTGRVALSLADRGVPVSGIDLSSAMVNRLRTKDVAHRIEVTIGDMATARAGDKFQLVYLAFNSIGNLTTQDEQVACFVNAAAHLEFGGYFVIESRICLVCRLEKMLACSPMPPVTSGTTATRTSWPSWPNRTILLLMKPE